MPKEYSVFTPKGSQHWGVSRPTPFLDGRGLIGIS
jgi:hypothetical protein